MSVSPGAEEEWFAEHYPDDADEPPGIPELILAVEHCTSKQRFVIELRYGLKDGSEYTVREVAELMGISHVAVVKIEERAIARMQRGVTKTSP